MGYLTSNPEPLRLINVSIPQTESTADVASLSTTSTLKVSRIMGLQLASRATAKGAAHLVNDLWEIRRVPMRVAHLSRDATRP
jgi:hypothetical protein